MKKLPTVYILGVITIVDLIFSKDPGISAFLWFGYGCYKYF